MLTEPLEIGRKYWTRDGRIATVTSLTYWKLEPLPEDGCTGGAYTRINDGSTGFVHKNGVYIGRADTTYDREYDLIELVRPIQPEFQPEQLSLF